MVPAWLLVLGTGLLMVGILFWMGTGPAPMAQQGADVVSGAGGDIQGRRGENAAATTGAAAIGAPDVMLSTFDSTTPKMTRFLHTTLHSHVAAGADDQLHCRGARRRHH